MSVDYGDRREGGAGAGVVGEADGDGRCRGAGADEELSVVRVTAVDVGSDEEVRVVEA